jgi:hypothetical protein
MPALQLAPQVPPGFPVHPDAGSPTVALGSPTTPYSEACGKTTCSSGLTTPPPPPAPNAPGGPTTASGS